MAEKSIPPSLWDDLTRGWTRAGNTAPHSFVKRWGDVLGANCHVGRSEANLLEFRCELNSIKLRGLDDVLCLVTGGSGVDPELGEVWRPSRTLARLMFVLALSDAAHQQALANTSTDRCLVLSPDEVRQLLLDSQPRERLIGHLRSAFSIRRLVPFNISHNASPNMFFGRHLELQQLLDDEDENFALAGPLGIGKTSLMKQYMKELVRRRDPRAQTVCYVNYYGCEDKSSDGVAQHLALKLDATSRSFRLQTSGFMRFLQTQKGRREGRLELVLDQVDEVCRTRAFSHLLEAGREGVCRLILGGQGELLRMVEHLPGPEQKAISVARPSTTSGPAQRRLCWIHLKPLSEAEARDLLAAPLQDLGFKLSDPDRMLSRILELSGQLPHLLHFYGRKLVDLALAEKTALLTMQHLDLIEWNSEAAQFFTDPLKNFSSVEARLLALRCLKEPDGVFTLEQLGEMAYAEFKRKVSPIELSFVRDELFINNVLAWTGANQYRVASGAIAYYARDLGYLDTALQYAREDLATRP